MCQNNIMQVSVDTLTSAACKHPLLILGKRTTRQIRNVVATICFIIVLANGLFAQYSADLNDINTGVYSKLRYAPQTPLTPTQRPVPIGNLGNPVEVIDLRGFVPMSLLSNSGYWRWTVVDNLTWFKIPTKKALLMLYYGDLQIQDIAKDQKSLELNHFRNTLFIQESNARGEAAQWRDIAYDFAERSGPIFEQLAGSGFESAEPTTIMVTPSTVFIFISFKYTSTLINHGQVLVAVEFARPARKFKTLYKLYSTELINKSATEAAVIVAPIAARVLAAYFGSNSQ